MFWSVCFCGVFAVVSCVGFCVVIFVGRVGFGLAWVLWFGVFRCGFVRILVG